MTEASLKALSTIRDLTMLKWYVIPLLAMVIYIYVKEIKEGRKTGNLDAVFAGLTVFGIDFFNETWNGWVLVLTDRSAFWTAPGDTALRTMVGWNIEIMFMFLLAGIAWYHTLEEDKKKKILGLPNPLFWAIGYSAFSVFIEWFLNKGGLLIWEYPFWERSFGGIILIFLFGYLTFYLGAWFIITRKTMKAKWITLVVIYSVPVILNIIGMGIMGWVY
ncbi:MAG: hypothetical protein DRI88_10930 [Bacteroidetes bacterium]|nr:MAG: hypothetical protein DRI88_10930 [Bacteroidota bacterium]RLD87930.1 MAG: hypothetical protein DRJ02_05155 [Bacteroidota bacterium]